MHEMSIAVSIAENVRTILRQYENVKPVSVRVRIGCLAGIVPEALDFSFSFAAKDIIGSVPTLEIEEVPVEGHCLDCNHRFTFETFPVTCPECDGIRIEHEGGRDLELTSLEVEDNDEGDNCQRKDTESQLPGST